MMNTNKISFMYPMEDIATRPKSPKSPKGLENPLLKTNTMFAPKPPSLMRASAQSPAPLPTSNPPLKSVTNTPGPPPKTSLSLNMKINSVSKQDSSCAYVTPAKKASAASIPVGSPSPFFSPSNAAAMQGASYTGDSVWVVAYGFTNQQELEALLSILKSCGQILATKSNSNWIAVQYPDNLCAAQASSKQIVPIGSVLCGISRATGQFLQELLARPSQPLGLSALPNTAAVENSLATSTSASLQESDILARYKGHGSTAADAKATGDVSAIFPTRVEDERLLVKIIYYFLEWLLR